MLPGIGPKVAARIVEYRTTKGPFKKIEELMEGIPEDTCADHGRGEAGSCRATVKAW
jgi:DNA uptake protein ComE-like DNA-binding protein